MRADAEPGGGGRAGGKVLRTNRVIGGGVRVSRDVFWHFGDCFRLFYFPLAAHLRVACGLAFSFFRHLGYPEFSF